MKSWELKASVAFFFLYLEPRSCRQAGYLTGMMKVGNIPPVIKVALVPAQSRRSIFPFAKW